VKKVGVTQTILERLENNMMKWYRYIVSKRIRDGLRIMTWSLEDDNRDDLKYSGKRNLRGLGSRGINI
jgi:hypothetical protein